MTTGDISYAIKRMLAVYEEETSSKPMQIVLSKRDYDVLVAELKGVHAIDHRWDYAHDPDLGVVIDDVMIGWEEG